MINIDSAIKIYSMIYDAKRHTFFVEYGSATSKVPENARYLTKSDFPNHEPFNFLDEKVRVHEQVTIFLKSEETLLQEGWKPWGKASLMKEGSLFRIGKDKRKLLGKAHVGTVGLTEKFEPLVFLPDGWRFSPDEIRCIIKREPVRGVEAKFMNAAGEWTYHPELGLSGPNLATGIRGVQLEGLCLILKKAKLV